MDTSECFMFGKRCDCLDLFVNVGKYNSPSIADLIICPLGKFSLIIFIVGRTLLRWKDTDVKLPVHPESATTELSSFVFCVFFVVGNRARLLHKYIFSS